MARPQKVTDEQILEASREAFLDHGAGFPTTAIAARLGISQAVLFQRFGTKASLLIAALAPEGRPEWLEAIERGPDGRAIPVQLLEIAERLTEYFREVLPSIAVLRQAGIELGAVLRRAEASPPTQIHRALEGWIEAAQAEGRVRSGDALSLALAFQGALQIHLDLGQAESDPLGPDGGAAAAYLREVVDLFWRGLAPEAAVCS